MALTNTQYNDIMREYDQMRTDARHLQEQRHRQVLANIPEYAELENQVSSFASAYTERMIHGDTTAQEELAREMQSIRSRKAALLSAHGLPADYLALQYHCPDCCDTGYIEGKKCHCFKQREISILYSQSHLEDVLQKENFDTLSYQYIDPAHLDSYRHTVQICQDYVAHFDVKPDSLIFKGTAGAGKTFLSNCIAKALLDSYHSVIYFSAVDLFQTISQSVFSKEKDGLYSLYEDLYNCDLVIIDDLGTELTNSFVGSQLFSLINERQLRSKPILISTNLDMNDLRDRYGERVMSRIISYFEQVEFTCPDIRISRKRKK